MDAARLNAIRVLYRWLPEAVDGGGGSLDWIGTGLDSKFLSFGPLYREVPRTWDELMRVLVLLRFERPGLYAHLHARYHGGYVTRRAVRFTKAGQPRLGACTELVTKGPAEGRSAHVLACVVHVWPDHVNEQQAREALHALADTFRGEPYLPLDLVA